MRTYHSKDTIAYWMLRRSAQIWVDTMSRMAVAGVGNHKVKPLIERYGAFSHYRYASTDEEWAHIPYRADYAAMRLEAIGGGLTPIAIA